MRYFKPGPYKKGEIVVAEDGSIWEVEANIAAATAQPSNNRYWNHIATPHKKDYFDITWFGAQEDVPNQPPFDNGPVFNNLIKLLGRDSVATIYVPAKSYRIYSTIDLTDTSISLEGESSTSTPNKSSVIFCMPGVRAITYSRKQSGAAFARVRRISFIGTPGVPDTDGLYANNQIQIEECNFSNFTGNGIYLDGSVISGTDSSLSRIVYTKVAQNGKSGMKFFMEDANQVTVFGCDARDNADYGYEDISFLGEQFISCHGNNNQKGHWYVENPNACATIVACYGEGGVAPSKINSNSIVIGGIHENGVTGGAAISGSRVLNHLKYLSMAGDQGGASIGFNGPNMFWDTPGGHESGFQLRYKPQYTPEGELIPQVSRWSMGFGNIDNDRDNYQMLGTGAYTEEPIAHPVGYKRAMNNASHHYKELYINGRLLTYIYEGIEKVLNHPYAQQYHTGDDLRNGLYNGSNAEGWKCIKSGTTGRYTEGRTATVIGADGYQNAVIQLNGNNTQLRIGDGVLIDGKYDGIITQFDGKNTRLILNIRIPAGQGMSIQYSPPKFKQY